MGRKKTDRYAEFRALSQDEKREKMLALTEMCIDGAPTFLARWVEIYFEAEGDSRNGNV